MTDPFDEVDDLRTFYEQIDSVYIYQGSDNYKVVVNITINSFEFLIRRNEYVDIEDGSGNVLLNLDLPTECQLFPMILLYLTTDYSPDIVKSYLR